MTIGDLSLKEVNSKEIEDFLQSNTDDMIGKQLFNNKDFPERPEQILEESKEYLEQAEHYTAVKRREQFHTSLQGRQ